MTFIKCTSTCPQNTVQHSAVLQQCLMHSILVKTFGRCVMISYMCPSNLTTSLKRQPRTPFWDLWSRVDGASHAALGKINLTLGEKEQNRKEIVEKCYLHCQKIHLSMRLQTQKLWMFVLFILNLLSTVLCTPQNTHTATTPSWWLHEWWHRLLPDCHGYQYCTRPIYHQPSHILISCVHEFKTSQSQGNSAQRGGGRRGRWRFWQASEQEGMV